MAKLWWNPKTRRVEGFSSRKHPSGVVYYPWDMPESTGKDDSDQAKKHGLTTEELNQLLKKAYEQSGFYGQGTAEWESKGWQWGESFYLFSTSVMNFSGPTGL